MMSSKLLENKKVHSENEISKKIIGAAIEVHRVLGGPGLLENVYESCLCYELELQGLRIDRQIAVPINYKGTKLEYPLYIDILVENLVIVEVKSTKEHNPVFESQLITYLKLSGLKLGLLVNFGTPFVKDGIKRIVNSL